MDNATKAIMIGVGLFITVIIISAVLVVVNMGRGFITNATGQLSGALTQVTTASQFVSELNGKTLTKSEVAQVLDLASDKTYKFPVVVANAKSGSGATKVVATLDAGYDVKGKVSSVIGTTPYAIENNYYITFNTSMPTTWTKGAVADLTADSYNAVVIQSRASGDLGLYIYATTITTR